MKGLRQKKRRKEEKRNKRKDNKKKKKKNKRGYLCWLLEKIKGKQVLMNMILWCFYFKNNLLLRRLNKSKSRK
ncbi:hypothetical protein A2U01_0089884, partial [Trifolium medium]|nr:hypothetical protein [Trifolium medium]